MIRKILIEINRLKNELDGYSAKEGLDYIESYINTLSKQQVKETDLDMKYIDADRIRAEIERRIKIQDDWIAKGLQGESLAIAVREELRQLLSFVSTINNE